MPETKIQGYVFRVTPRSRSALYLKIGKKVAFAFVGRGGDLSLPAAREAILILEAGAGSISLGGYNLLAGRDGTDRLLTLLPAGSAGVSPAPPSGGKSVRLSPPETAAVIATLEAAIKEAEAK